MTICWSINCLICSQTTSLHCACTSLDIVLSSILPALDVITERDSKNICVLSQSRQLLVVDLFSSWVWCCTASIEIPSSMSLPFLLIVGSCNNESTAWCLTLAQCMTSNLNSTSCRRYLSFFSTSAALSFQLNAWWTAPIISFFLSTWKFREWRDHTMVSQFLWVVSRFFAGFPSVRSQYTIGLSWPSPFFSSRAQPACYLPTFISRVYRAFLFGSANDSVKISVSLRVSRTFSLSRLRMQVFLSLSRSLEERWRKVCSVENKWSKDDLQSWKRT